MRLSFTHLSPIRTAQSKIALGSAGSLVIGLAMTLVITHFYPNQPTEASIAGAIGGVIARAILMPWVTADALRHFPSIVPNRPARDIGEIQDPTGTDQTKLQRAAQLGLAIGAVIWLIALLPYLIQLAQQ